MTFYVTSYNIMMISTYILISNLINLSLLEMCIQGRLILGLLAHSWLVRSGEFSILSAIILKWVFQVGESGCFSIHMSPKCNLDQSLLELDLRKHRCLPHVPKTYNPTRKQNVKVQCQRQILPCR